MIKKKKNNQTHALPGVTHFGSRCGDALHDAASSAAQSDIGQCLNGLPELLSRAVAEVLGSGGGPTLGQPANCMHMHARQKHTVGGDTQGEAENEGMGGGCVDGCGNWGSPQLEGRPSRQSLVKVPEEKKKGSP